MKLSARELEIRALREARWRETHGGSEPIAPVVNNVVNSPVVNAVVNKPVVNNSVVNVVNSPVVNSNANANANAKSKSKAKDKTASARMTRWLTANADRRRAYMRDYMRRRRGSGEAIKNPGA